MAPTPTIPVINLSIRYALKLFYVGLILLIIYLLVNRTPRGPRTDPGVPPVDANVPPQDPTSTAPIDVPPQDPTSTAPIDVPPLDPTSTVPIDVPPQDQPSIPSARPPSSVLPSDEEGSKLPYWNPCWKKTEDSTQSVHKGDAEVSPQDQPSLPPARPLSSVLPSDVERSKLPCWNPCGKETEGSTQSVHQPVETKGTSSTGITTASGLDKVTERLPAVPEKALLPDQPIKNSTGNKQKNRRYWKKKV